MPVRHVLWMLCLFAALFAVQDPDEGVRASTPEQIAAIGSDRESLIGGIVSPLSGQVCLRTVDLFAQGAQPIALSRTYIASSASPSREQTSKWESFQARSFFYKGLTASYRGWTFLPHLYAIMRGDWVRLTSTGGSTFDFRLSDSELLTPLHGICGSAEQDPRNTRLRREGSSLFVLTPDGRQLVYTEEQAGFCLLRKEILPNGKVLRYAYENRFPVRMESLDPREIYVYASIALSETHAENHAGDRANYQRTPRIAEEQFKGKHKQGSYRFSFPAEITAAGTPAFRSERTTYTPTMQMASHSGKEHRFACTYALTDGVLRVHTLSLPVGKDGAYAVVYEISYDPPRAGIQGGSTTVLRSDGVKIVYRFSAELLLDAMLTYRPDGTLAKEQRWVWDKDHRLKAVELKDGSGGLLHRKEFEYDRWGNPIVETCSGHLCETAVIHREYSDDGKNLLLREETPEGKTTFFRYLAGTNFPLTKDTLDKTAVLQRESWAYDAHHNLIEHAVDDGIQRTATRYRLRQENPCLHMPEWIEEWGGDKLLRTTRLHYDKRGNVDRRDLFSGDGTWICQTACVFDEQGNILSETDACGCTETFRYNEAAQKVFALSKSGKLEQRMHYDADNRLVRLDEGADGNTLHTTLWEHDPLGRCLKTTDPLGNATTYRLDPVTGETAAITDPLGHTTTADIDPFGRKIRETDPLGNTTSTRYNARGSPVEIAYADSSRETFSYFKDGSLRLRRDADGIETSYEREALGRITLLKTGDSAVERFTYSGFHLIAHTDKRGALTRWEYDPAGRKIAEHREGRTTRFSYDPLDHLSAMDCSGLFAVEYTRDLLGRILEQRELDVSGALLRKIGYEWDADGHQTAILRMGRETRAFDGFGRLIEETDALGNRTLVAYDESSANLTIRSTDPNGIVTETVYDPCRRPISKRIGAEFVARKTFDAAGNLLQIEENGRIARYVYDVRNRAVSLTRAFGTADARTTAYAYSPAGRLQSKTLPSGLSLRYAYDSLGALESLTSSDGSLAEQFCHSPSGDLLFADSGEHTLQRDWDGFGNLVQETLDGHLTLCKSYDAAGRLNSLTLPDGSSIRYTYRGPLLQSVARHARDGKLLYTHAYSAYDLSGSVLSEQMICNLGAISHAYTQTGQEKHLASPYFEEQIGYDPGGRVISIGKRPCAYDDLNQLTRDGENAYAYDGHRNRLGAQANALDELAGAVYDLNGSLLACGDRRYRYDAQRQLVQAGDVHFAYDPLNRLFSRTARGQGEFYLYHGAEELGAFSADGETLALKIPGLCHKPVALELSGSVYAPLLDTFGNIRRLVDAGTGQIAEAIDYSAFGEETVPRFALSPWRYRAKRFDGDLGLYTFGKRWYDPATGRWLTLDPAGFVDGMNLYAYVKNNPLLYIDPEGLFAIPLVSLAFGAGVAFTPIGWLAVGLAVAGYAAAWSIDKMVESGRMSPQTASAATTIFGGLAGSVISSIPQTAWDVLTGKRMGNSTYIPGVGFVPNDFLVLDRKKEGSVDPSLPTNPDDLLKRPGWKETTHPDAGKRGHRAFENAETGEKLYHDKGQPGAFGHRGHDHWHRPNPNTTGKHDEFLDGRGRPVPDKSEPSHIYSPESVWWQ